jgi:hypothetical protein
MPDKSIAFLISLTEGTEKFVPYLLGLMIGLPFIDALLKITVTALAMVIGKVFMHFVAPIIIKKIEGLKKND